MFGYRTQFVLFKLKSKRGLKESFAKMEIFWTNVDC
jgi:hypothetical protein